MFAIHALYHGRSRRRADYIRDVAEALASTSAVSDVRIYGAEGFAVVSPDADGATTVVLNLLQAGDFAVGIGAVVADPDDVGDPGAVHDQLFEAAARSFGRQHRAATVTTRVELPGPGGVRAPGTPADVADDVTAAFTLLAHVLTRRTPEGREATALMRQGYLQTEAADYVGISKQAMSQRLQAAGWAAEMAGWQLAINVMERANKPA